MTGALAIGFAAMLTLSGCGAPGGDIDADYQLYEAASAAMNEAVSIEMDMNTTMNMKSGEEGSDFGFKMEGNIKTIKKSDTEFEMEMRQTTDMLGASSETVTYFKDGYMYIEMDGERIKMELPMEDALAQANNSAMVFDQSAIQKSSSKDTDGGKEIVFTVSGDALKDYIEQGTAGALAGLNEGVDINYGDSIITAVIDKDINMVSLSLSMSFDIAAVEEGESVTTEITIDMFNISTDNITIDFPADLDSYEAIAA
jgi:hypothetical protein